MATLASATQLASATPDTTDSFAAPTSLKAEIRFFWQQFIVAAFDPYRPELHYMRGPGPACRARDARRPRSH